MKSTLLEILSRQFVRLWSRILTACLVAALTVAGAAVAEGLSPEWLIGKWQNSFVDRDVRSTAQAEFKRMTNRNRRPNASSSPCRLCAERIARAPTRSIFSRR
jgi:hypothetical protein